MKRWLDRLDTWLRDRNDARGTVLFCLGCLPLLGVLWSFQAHAMGTPAVLALFDANRLQLTHIALSLAIVWLSLLGVVGWVQRKDSSGRGTPMLGYLAVTPTLAVVVFMWMGYGFLDTPLGMVVMEVLILSRAFFPMRVVWPGMVLGVLIMLAAAVLEAQHVLGSAPLLSAPVFSGATPVWWWRIWLRVVFNAGAWPFVIALVYLFSRLAQQRADLETLANTDAHTGLFNRREFMNRLANESHRHERSGLPMSVIMIDLDHFKRVNDTHGHAAGDVVLSQVGKLIRAGLRQHIDVAARMGGEEFALLLPQTDVAGAERVAAKLGAALRECKFIFDSQPLVVTLSAGVAQVSGGRGELALRVADDNLLQAKRAGRDRFVASMV